MGLYPENSQQMLNKNVYWVADEKSIFARWALAARIDMFRYLASRVNFEALQSVLDVGVTAEQGRGETNLFEACYPYKDRVTALSQQDASWIEQKWPGMTFVSGDGRNLPFDDNQFDLVVSFAVLEHVGSRENQLKFLSECCRVARKYVFIATPNAWYPMELHTVLPLLHWLPRRAYRRVLRWFRLDFFADENHLNLLTRRQLSRFCQAIGQPQYTVGHIRFFGLPSNLLLLVEKGGQGQRERSAKR